MPNAADLDEALAVAGKLTPLPAAKHSISIFHPLPPRFLDLLLHFQSESTNFLFRVPLGNPTFNGL